MTNTLTLSDAIEEAYENAPADTAHFDTFEINCDAFSESIKVVVSHEAITVTEGTFIPVPTIEFELPETVSSSRGQFVMRVPGIPRAARGMVRAAAKAREIITIQYRQYLEGESDPDAESPSAWTVVSVHEQYGTLEITAMLPDLVGMYFPRRLMTFCALYGCYDTRICDCTAILWDYENSPETIGANSDVFVYVSSTEATGKRCGPYVWSVAGTGYSLEYSQTDNPVNILHSDGSPGANAAVTVETCDGKSVTGYLRGAGGSWVALEFGSIGSGGGCTFDTEWIEYYNTPICRFRFQLQTNSECGSGYQGCFPEGATPCSEKCPLDEDGEIVTFPNSGYGAIHTFSLEYWS